MTIPEICGFWKQKVQLWLKDSAEKAPVEKAEKAPVKKAERALVAKCQNP